MYFSGKEKGDSGSIGMKTCAGCGILMKKEQEGRIRTTLPDPLQINLKPDFKTIAQLVEHRTGIAEVTGSNPVEALIFSGFFFPIA